MGFRVARLGRTFFAVGYGVSGLGGVQVGV